jgi:hypothetical protein
MIRIFFSLCLLLILVDGITSLALARFIFSLRAPAFPNALYAYCLLTPISVSFLDTTYFSRFYHFSCILLFAVAALMCGYTASSHIAFISSDTTLAEIELQNPGDWKGLASFRAAVLIVVSLECVAEIFLHGRRGVENRYAPVQDHPKPFYRLLLNLSFWTFTAFALLLFFVGVFPLHTAIWQLCDAPHASLIAGGNMAHTLFRAHWWVWYVKLGYVLFLLTAWSISVSHLFYEVEMVNRDAQWLDASSYINAFNSTNLPGYRFKEDQREDFQTVFMQDSAMMHEYHLYLVVLGGSVVFSVLTTFVGWQRRWGRMCV